MPKFLLIETSTHICSVALSIDNQIVAEKISREDKVHAAILAPFIQDVFTETGINAGDLDAVVVSKGPGSYTGLRIGVATAKGLAYAAQKPLLSVNTLRMMGAGFLSQHPMAGKAFLIPMIDARRMEVYSAVFSEKMEKLRETRADIIDNQSYLEYLDQGQVYFFGNGADKCRTTIIHNNAVFVDDFEPKAAYLLPDATEKYAQKAFEDIAYFEPFYLKDFLAGIPKKNIFH